MEEVVTRRCLELPEPHATMFTAMLTRGRVIARALMPSLLVLVSSCGEPTQAANPLPALFAATPASVTVGSTNRAIRLSGRDFIRTSRARVNGTDRTTAFVSDSVLTVTLTEADVATLSVLAITVFNGLPGGGASGTVTLAVANATPGITSLTPATLDGPLTSLDTITVAGVGFLPSTQVFFDTFAIPSTPVSSTVLKVLVPSFIASAGTHAITASNPSTPRSAPATLTIRNRVPTLSNTVPDTITQGLSNQSITVAGANFIEGMVISVNGTARTTTVTGDSSATVLVLAADLATLGTLTFTATNRAPTAGPSAPLSVRVAARSPVVSGFQPAAITAGTGPTALQVLGEGFVTGAVIEWNGTPLATTFVTQARVDAAVPATLTATAQPVTITVRNPNAAGSAPVTLSVLASTLGISSTVTANLAAASIEWVASRNLLYATITAGANASSVVAIDPTSATISATVPLGANGAAMAASHDGQFLYVARSGAPTVARIALAVNAIDINIPVGSDDFLGPIFAEDLATLPGLPRSVVMTRAYSSVSPRNAGTAIYDDAVRRNATGPSHTGANRIESVNATTLLGYNNETTEFGLRRFTVSVSGLAQTLVRNSEISGFGADISLSGSRVVATTGEVVDVANLRRVGALPFRGTVVADASQGRIFIASQGRIYVFGLYSLTELGSFAVPSVDTGVNKMVRFGADGLAILTNSQLVFVRGSLIGN